MRWRRAASDKIIHSSAARKAAFDQLNDLYAKGSGYTGIMVTRPQTLGYSLADSPVWLAAWFHDKFADWTYTGGHPEYVATLVASEGRHQQSSCPRPCGRESEKYSTLFELLDGDLSRL
jgi:hypothetical protein